MRISTELFEGIIGRPNVAVEKDGARRLSGRMKVAKRATLSRKGSIVRIRLTIIDISLGGVGLIYPSPFTPGEQFSLRITGRDGTVLAVDSSVRWCRPTNSGRFQVGAEFVRLIDDETKLQPSEAGCGRAGERFSS